MRGHTGQSRFPYDDDDDDHYAGAQAGLTSLRAQLSRVADTWEAQKNRERAADARRINSLTAELRQSQTEVAEVQGARELNSDGLMLGGWEAARPKVAAPRTRPNPRLGPTPTLTPLTHTLTPSPRPRPSLTPQPSPPVHPLSRCRAPTPDR